MKIMRREGKVRTERIGAIGQIDASEKMSVTKLREAIFSLMIDVTTFDRQSKFIAIFCIALQWIQLAALPLRLLVEGYFSDTSKSSINAVATFTQYLVLDTAGLHFSWDSILALAIVLGGCTLLFIATIPTYFIQKRRHKEPHPSLLYILRFLSFLTVHVFIVPIIFVCSSWLTCQGIPSDIPGSLSMCWSGAHAAATVAILLDCLWCLFIAYVAGIGFCEYNLSTPKLHTVIHGIPLASPLFLKTIVIVVSVATSPSAIWPALVMTLLLSLQLLYQQMKHCYYAKPRVDAFNAGCASGLLWITISVFFASVVETRNAELLIYTVTPVVVLLGAFMKLSIRRYYASKPISSTCSFNHFVAWAINQLELARQLELAANVQGENRSTSSPTRRANQSQSHTNDNVAIDMITTENDTDSVDLENEPLLGFANNIGPQAGLSNHIDCHEFAKRIRSQVEDAYQSFAAKQQTNAALQLHAAQYFSETHQYSFRVLRALETAYNASSSIYVQYVTFVALRKVRNRFQEDLSIQSGYQNAAFEQQMSSALTAERSAFLTMLRFWSILNEPVPDLSKLRRTVNKLRVYINKASTSYSEALTLSGEDAELLSSYGFFLRDLLNSPDQAQLYLNKAERCNKKAGIDVRTPVETFEFGKLLDGLDDIRKEQSAKLLIGGSEDLGHVRYANAAAARLLCTPIDVCTTMDIMDIFPEPLNYGYMTSLRRLINSADGHKLEQPHLALLADSSRRLVPVRMIVQEADPGYECSAAVGLCLHAVDPTEGLILCNLNDSKHVLAVSAICSRTESTLCDGDLDASYFHLMPIQQVFTNVHLVNEADLHQSNTESTDDHALRSILQNYTGNALQHRAKPRRFIEIMPTKINRHDIDTSERHDSTESDVSYDEIENLYDLIHDSHDTSWSCRAQMLPATTRYASQSLDVHLRVAKINVASASAVLICWKMVQDPGISSSKRLSKSLSKRSSSLGVSRRSIENPGSPNAKPFASVSSNINQYMGGNVGTLPTILSQTDGEPITMGNRRRLQQTGAVPSTESRDHPLRISVPVGLPNNHAASFGLIRNPSAPTPVATPAATSHLSESNTPLRIPSINDRTTTEHSIPSYDNTKSSADHCAMIRGSRSRKNTPYDESPIVKTHPSGMNGASTYKGSSVGSQRSRVMRMLLHQLSSGNGNSSPPIKKLKLLHLVFIVLVVALCIVTGVVVLPTRDTIRKYTDNLVNAAWQFRVSLYIHASTIRIPAAHLGLPIEPYETTISEFAYLGEMFDTYTTSMRLLDNELGIDSGEKYKVALVGPDSSSDPFTLTEFSVMVQNRLRELQQIPYEDFTMANPTVAFLRDNLPTSWPLYNQTISDNLDGLTTFVNTTADQLVLIASILCGAVAICFYVALVHLLRQVSGETSSVLRMFLHLRVHLVKQFHESYKLLHLDHLRRNDDDGIYEEMMNASAEQQDNNNLEATTSPGESSPNKLAKIPRKQSYEDHAFTKVKVNNDSADASNKHGTHKLLGCGAHASESAREYLDSNRFVIKSSLVLGLPLLIMVGWLFFIYFETHALLTNVRSDIDRIYLTEQSVAHIFQFRSYVSSVLLYHDPAVREPARIDALQKEEDLLATMRTLMHGAEIGPFGEKLNPIEPERVAYKLMVEDGCVPNPHQIDCYSAFNKATSRGYIAALHQALNYGRGVMVMAPPGSPLTMADLVKTSANDDMRELVLIDGNSFRWTSFASTQSFLDTAHRQIYASQNLQMGVAAGFALLAILFLTVVSLPSIRRMATSIEASRGMLRTLPEDAVYDSSSMRNEVKRIAAQVHNHRALLLSGSHNE